MRHELPIERLQGLEDGRGLREDEVAARRGRYGSNDIVEEPRNRWRELALETAKDPMLAFLVATSGVYAALGERLEALVLAASIVPLAGMDAYLHRRTQASTHALQGQLATRARVLREGRELEIASAEVVVGDLAVVRRGEPFPADGVVLEACECQVDESALTGESFPVLKAPPEAWPTGSPARLDGEHWGFAGTRVLRGDARIRVAWVGAETIYGGVVRSALSGGRARTPLQVSVAALVRTLVVAAVALCAMLAFVRWRQGHGLLDALVNAMTLAIAALPEEFPVVLAVFLGVGVLRLGRRGALVRRAVTVENIGRVTAICSDKTGTITEGRLHLTHIVPARGRSEARVLECALHASLEGGDDPLDVAVNAAAKDVARTRTRERFPFTEDRKRESALIESEAGLTAVTKGSPEAIFALCALDGLEREAALRAMLELAADGHKVIACASQVLARDTWAGGEPDRGFEFEGLLAFEDPLRPGVREALAECAEAGIRTVLVTGDHPATARAIARDAGLGGARLEVVLGEDVERLAREEPSKLLGADVVARAVPSQKLALVRSFQLAGEVVAVTGDGVNDVPALQAADVGIAMGGRGTRAAREVASIVLLDDDFATIVRAVSEGRQLFRNLQMAFQYLLVVHLPLVLSAAVIPLAGQGLAYLPVHVVALELMIHPTVLLVYQELPPTSRLRPSLRRASGTFFSRGE